MEPVLNLSLNINYRKTLILVLLLLFYYVPIGLGNVGQVTLREAEDREFIRNLFQDELHDLAEEEAQAYLQRYKKGFFRAEVIFILAQVSVIQKKYDLALKNYDRILKEFPRSRYVEEALFQAGILRIQLGNRKKGEADINQLIKAFPETKFKSAIHYPMGLVAYNKKSWKKAQFEFQKALSSKNLDPLHRLEAEHLLAWIYHFQKNEKSAKKSFLRLLTLPLNKNSKAKIAFQLAVYAQNKNDYLKANYWYNRQLKEWPSEEFRKKSRFWIAENTFQLSQSKTKKPLKKDLLVAIQYFTKNIYDKDPINPVISRYHRGWLYQQLGQIDKVEIDFAWLQKNSKLYADDLSLTLIRAQNYEKNNNRKKANEIYMERLRRINDPSSQGLWLQVFRNAFQEKDCLQLLDREKERKISFKKAQNDEVLYYLGRCYQETGDEIKAIKAYSEIDANSRYWEPVFDDHLRLLKNQEDYSGAIRLLNEGLQILGVERKEELLTNRLSFHQELRQWYDTINTIKELLVLNPQKNKDPWLLLILAESYDHLVNTPEEFEKRKDKLKNKEYYQLLALYWYRRVYLLLPSEENRQRLSILNLLVTRYEERGEYRQLIDLYEEALPLVGTSELRDDLTMRIARIYFDQLQDRDKARIWYSKLHLKGNRDIHYEASSILAEMKIDDGDYPGAIKILKSLSKMDIEGTQWYLKTHFRLAELYQVLEKWSSATLHYNKVAITISDQSGDSTYQSVHYRLGELYQIQEKWGLALKHYRRLIKSPQNSDLKKMATENYKKIKQYLRTVEAKRKQDEELKKAAEEKAKQKKLVVVKAKQKKRAAKAARKKAAADAFEKSDAKMKKSSKKKRAISE